MGQIVQIQLEAFLHGKRLIFPCRSQPELTLRHRIHLTAADMVSPQRIEALTKEVLVLLKEAKLAACRKAAIIAQIERP